MVGAVTSLHPVGWPVAIGIAATSVISKEPDSTVKTPGEDAKRHAENIGSGDWLRKPIERD